MPNQTERHPYWRGLAKKIVTFVVMYNVVLICFGATLFIFGIFAFIGSAASSSYGSEMRQIYGSGNRQLLSIPVEGVIVGDEVSSGDFFSSLAGPMTSGYEVKDKLMTAASDGATHGIILEINSPGGTIYGARAIADGVKYYREKTQQPVYAYIQGSGTSGAYWAAISADRVVADYGSDIGSIGVILGPFEYYDKVIATDGGLLGGGVITQNGIESVNITAGKSKDVGDPNRRLTEEEIASLQKSVNNEYDQFVAYVSKQRHISEQAIRDQIRALWYDPKTAKELKMIDGIGSKDETYQALAEAAGVAGDFFVVREYPLPGPFDELFSAKSSNVPSRAEASLCSGKKVMAVSGDLQAWCKQE